MLNSYPTLERVRPLDKKSKGQQFESVISKFAKVKITLANSYPTLERVRPLNKKGKSQQFGSLISKLAKGKITLAQW